MGVLTTKGRKHIAPSNFVFPKDKRYPIHDLAHSRNALARASGKPEEAKVKAAVYAKYPALKARAKARGIKAASSVEMRDFFGAAIQLSVTAESPENPDVQILKTGSFSHPKYGEFEITTAMLNEMKENFDDHIRGSDIAFDYFHKSDEDASGWPTELYFSDDGEELWAKVDWTPTAQKKLAEREIRYFSPDFAFEWTHPETGVKYNNVLFGGGLTNRPFLKDMAAIVADEGENMTLKELEAKVLELAEAGDTLSGAHDALVKDHADLLKKHAKLAKAHGDLQTKMAEMEASESGLDPEDEKEITADAADGDPAPADEPEPDAPGKGVSKQMAELQKKILHLEASKKLAERESEFHILMSEGRACAAQKPAFLKGNMSEFAKLAEKVNLTPAGSGNAEDVTDADATIKLAEEMCAADKKLTMVDAISKAVHKLAKK